MMVTFLTPPTGDDASDGTSENAPQRSDRSHMIIWQSASPSVPNPALWPTPLALGVDNGEKCLKHLSLSILFALRW